MAFSPSLRAMLRLLTMSAIGCGSAVAVDTSFGGAVSVKTSFGSVVGTKTKWIPSVFGIQGCDKYLGIPYAMAPVGERRFQDPVPWSAAYPATGFQATSYGDACSQLGGGNEDCLSLNVWRPDDESLVNLPVMVWIHGGSFILGASSSGAPPVPTILNIYDGCGLASDHKLVVASMNYRLGPFGFAAFDEDGESKGNFGLKDQRQALVWLQRELKAFGGDPGKVTIFGESAGAISVYYHVASPASKGLFRAAISESGWPDAWGWEHSRNVTNAFASTLGCHDTTRLRACFQNMTTKMLIKNAGEAANPFTHAGWWPTVEGGNEMPRYPQTLFNRGETNGRVPILAGTNSDEANLFVYPLKLLGLDEENYRRFIREIFNGRDPVVHFSDSELDQLLELYAGTAMDGKDKRRLAGQLMTDGTFVCADHLAGEQYRQADYWMYRFNHRLVCDDIIAPEVPGVFHGMEVPIVWGGEAKTGCLWTLEELALSKRMRKMWANFATHMDPMAGETGWPRYNNITREALVIQTPSDFVEQDSRGEVCKFWQATVFSKFDRQSGAPPIPKEVIV